MRNLRSKVSELRTTFENNSPSAQKCHSAGVRGVPEFVYGWNPNIFVSQEPMQSFGTLKQPLLGFCLTSLVLNTVQRIIVIFNFFESQIEIQLILHRKVKFSWNVQLNSEKRMKLFCKSLDCVGVFTPPTSLFLHID